MTRYVLQEDDCAPDSLEYFEAQMQEKLGLNIAEFKAKAEHSVKDDCDMWVFNGYRLEVSPDHPWYTLAEVLS